MIAVAQMEMSVEQFEQIINALDSQHGNHAAVLLLLGVLAFAGIIFAMWWVLNLKLAPMEKLSNALEASVKELNSKIEELSKNLWKRDELENKIKLEVAEQIKEHEKNFHTNNQSK
jgi:hypothetical protein